MSAARRSAHRPRPKRQATNRPMPTTSSQAPISGHWLSRSAAATRSTRGRSRRSRRRGRSSAAPARCQSAGPATTGRAAPRRPRRPPRASGSHSGAGPTCSAAFTANRKIDRVGGRQDGVERKRSPSDGRLRWTASSCWRPSDYHPANTSRGLEPMPFAGVYRSGLGQHAPPGHPGRRAGRAVLLPPRHQRHLAPRPRWRPAPRLASRMRRGRPIPAPDGPTVDPASFRDPAGFVFRRGGVLYRQVQPPAAADWEAYRVQSGLHERLSPIG